MKNKKLFIWVPVLACLWIGIFNNVAAMEITVHINIEGGDHSDTLYLLRYGKLLDNHDVPLEGISDSTLCSVKDRNGNFNFSYCIHDKFEYFSLGLKNVSGTFAQYRYLIPYFPAKNSDTVALFIFDSNKESVYGNLAFGNLRYVFGKHTPSRYKIKYTADSIGYFLPVSKDVVFVDHSGRYNINNPFYRKLIASLGYLESSKKLLSIEEYQLLASNTKGRWNYAIGRILYGGPEQWRQQNNNRKEFVKAYEDAFLPWKGNTDYMYSNEIAQAFFQKEKVILKYGYGHVNRDSLLVRLVNNYKGDLRNKLLAIFCNNYSMDFIRSKTEAASIASEYLVHSLYANTLENIKKASLQIDDFEFMDTSKKIVKLRSFSGNYILVDLWFTGCGSCVNYYKNVLLPLEGKYGNIKGIKFVSISIDTGYELWKKTLQGDLYTSKNSINLFTLGKGSDHPMVKKLKINSFPNIMLIDKQGRRMLHTNEELIDKLSLDSLLNSLMEH